MKGDFSRVRFNRAKHYTSVLQQQGRVALDADANEQCAIDEDLRANEIIDVIGPFGGPENEAGFSVHITGSTIEIGSGHYYVHGLLCENLGSVSYLKQPFLLNPPASDSQLLTQLTTSNSIQIFLEVWQRLVTSLDDPCLLEPALGQADTTARLQTVWRAVAQLVTPGANTPSFVVSPVATETPDCCSSMYEPTDSVPGGSLNAQTSGSATADCSCDPTSAPGYRGLENQLYRVEIHQSGTETTATFKWSRENGSVVVGITSAAGSQLQVDSLGPDANLGFASGQWVEISDDTYIFGTPPNMPGQLTQIQSITPGQFSLTVAPPVSGIDPAQNARMRRWDQSGSSAGSKGIPVSTAWVNLENGIQVQFAAGNYTAGDYWLIPARTASGQIDWPPSGGDGAAFQPPRQTQVFRAPLACIHANAANANQRFTVEDCRRFFRPLSKSAMHVTGTSWNNDDVISLDQLLVYGLIVSLDGTPTGILDSSIFSLTLEGPATTQNNTYLNAPSTIVAPTACMVLEGGPLAVQNQSISWTGPSAVAGSGVPSNLLLSLGDLSNWLFPQAGDHIYNPAPLFRVRVRLRGGHIYRGLDTGRVFLDGQTFGTPGMRADGVTPRTALTFPSGANARASDFESWFFVAPVQVLIGLTLTPATVSFVPSQLPPGGVPVLPVGTVTLSYPAVADTVVTLSLSATAPAPLAAVSLPATVTVHGGQSSATFQVGVTNPKIVTAQYSIAASLNNAIGLLSSTTAGLTVSGN